MNDTNDQSPEPSYLKVLKEIPEFDTRPEVQTLFKNLKENLPKLEETLKKINEHWVGEDMVYRFYHYSFKVYGLQGTTQDVVDKLKELLPGKELNETFSTIISQGTGKKWEREHNRRWLEETRPILEAFFHARYFLEIAVKYGKELENPPNWLPSGWAAFLYLYNLR